MSGFGHLSLATQKRKEQEVATENLHAKTFGAWANHQLSKRGYPKIKDLNEELRDGVHFIHLVEALYGEKVGKKYEPQPLTEIHKIQNVAIALDFLQAHNINVQVNSKDITDGNRKLTLGLVWRLIMGHQMLDAQDNDKPATQRNKVAKQNLISFCKKQTEGYQGVEINDLDQSFHNGLAFGALVHSINPDIVDWSQFSASNPQKNLEMAFAAAEKLGIPRMLEVEDMLNADPSLRPDEKCIMTYVSEFPLAFIAHGKPRSSSQTIDPNILQREEERRREIEEEATRQAEKLKMENERLAWEAEQFKKLAQTVAVDNQTKNLALSEEQRKMQEELEKLKRENERLQAEVNTTKNKLIGKLNLTIKEAKELAVMDILGKSDPYVRLKLENQEYKTKTIKKSLAPKWEQEFEFFITDKRSELELAVWDWDRFTKDSFMGKASLKVSELKDGQSESKWLKLQPLKEGDKKVSGEILVSFSFHLGK